MQIELLIPVYNDWDSVEKLIMQLDQAFASSADSVAVLLVDDGSTIEMPAAIASKEYTTLREVSILRLKKNVGHQRALAVGLCYISEKIQCDIVVVMDGDGEDKPGDAVRLVEKLKEQPSPTIIFAERTRRSETLAFGIGYSIYRILHYVLTGLSVRVGNFSAIPASCIASLTVEPMLWNHYAASAHRARLRIATIPTQRGLRITGSSHLNFVGHTIHGLSALACYSEIIGVRIIMISGFLFVLALLALAALIWLKMATSLAVPGWASLLFCLLIVMILQIATLVSNFTMQIISARSSQPFLPARDYSWFISNFRILYGKA